LPALKKLTITDSAQKRQSWRQQLEIMSDWAGKHNAYVALKEKMDGR
jgi:hypothetical protein